MSFRARRVVSPICEVSSKRQGDGQRFQKKAMKTTNQKIEASAPANGRPSSVSKHQANRELSTEAVLNCLRTKLPQQYELAEVVGKWVWLPCHQHGNQCWQRFFVPLAFIGISGAVSGSIRAASLTRSAVIPPTRAPSIVLIFPPT